MEDKTVNDVFITIIGGMVIGELQRLDAKIYFLWLFLQKIKGETKRRKKTVAMSTEVNNQQSDNRPSDEQI